MNREKVLNDVEGVTECC